MAVSQDVCRLDPHQLMLTHVRPAFILFMAPVKAISAITKHDCMLMRLHSSLMYQHSLHCTCAGQTPQRRARSQTPGDLTPPVAPHTHDATLAAVLPCTVAPCQKTTMHDCEKTQAYFRCVQQNPDQAASIQSSAHTMYARTDTPCCCTCDDPLPTLQTPKRV
jgi:hypothetical protein